MQETEEESLIKQPEPLVSELPIYEPQKEAPADTAGLVSLEFDTPMSIGGTPEEKSKTPEEHEQHTEDRVADLRLKIEEIIALSDGDAPPEILAARNDLAGAGAKHIDPQKLQQIDQAVREKSAQQNLETVMGMVLPLAAVSAILNVGKELFGKDVEGDGRHLPPEALFTEAVDNGIEAPMPKRQVSEGIEI